MEIQQRILKFVTRTNWILLTAAGTCGICLTPAEFARGIIYGGLIVTINFHLLSRTLKKAFAPQRLSSSNAILAKYYVRFIVSGFIIFGLISQHIVNPLGLFIGLSIVVASIMIATFCEVTRIIFKEAT